jgi:putative ABC transport system ATP-binding protein
MADEPTGNLDSKSGGEIMELLIKLNQERGKTIIMVTHIRVSAACPASDQRV